MRIAILHDHAWPLGGSELVAIRSAEELARRGHDVHFIGGVRSPEERGPAGCKLHALHQPPLAEAGARAMLRGLWNPHAARLLAEVLRAGTPGETVVHVHSWGKLLTSSVFRTSLRLGAPTVVTLHDYGITCPNAGFYDYPADAICLRKPLGLACLARDCDKASYAHKVWRVARSVMERTVGRTRDPRLHLLSVTAFARDIQARDLPARMRPRVLENPLFSQGGSPQSAARKPYVFFGGRIGPEKGVDLLAEAAADLGIHAIVAGEGPLLDDLRVRFPTVEFVGHVDRSRFLELMAGAQVVAVPSRWYETQALVAWEAAALGVPVLAPRGTAPGSFVEEARAGLTFDRGNAASLRDALAALWHDAERRRAMGQAGRRFVASRDLSLSTHVDRLEAFYSALPAPARPAAA